MLSSQPAAGAPAQVLGADSQEGEELGRHGRLSSGFVPSATGPTFWEGAPLALLVWNTKQNGSSGFPPGLNLNVLSLDFSYSADTEVIARNHSVLQAYQPGSAEEGQR